MEKSLELFIQQVRLSARFVTRDYFELESLQATGRYNRDYARNTCSRLLQNYIDSCGKYFKKIIYRTEDLASTGNVREFLLIELMDGYENLVRSLPYFASVATKMVNKGGKYVPEMTVIIMPGNNEIYYAMSGKGAWKEKLSASHSGSTRLRVSNVIVKNANKTALDDLLVGTAGVFFENASTISRNIRIFACDSFLSTQVASGKVDVALLKSNPLLNPAFELLLQESGGVFFSSGDVQLATTPNLQAFINKYI